MKYRSIHKVIVGLCLCMTFSTTLWAATGHYFPLRYTVSGISDPAVQKNVNIALQNFHDHLEFPLTPAEIIHFSDKAPKIIKNAIVPYGYFRVQIQSTLKKTQRDWLAQFHVALGSALPISAIHIRIEGAGKNDPKFKHWLKKIPLHIGDRLQTTLYENAKTNLYDLATERGYFKAKMIKSEIQINLQTYHAVIIIVFNTGPRFRFGPTTFSTSLFHHAFLKKFLTYQEGHYYDAKKLEKTQEGLVSSNYFNQVDINSNSKAAKNNCVPIHIALIVRKAKQYTLGLGYGTDTGARATGGITLRHLGSNGHRFQTLLRASQDNSSVIARYMIPGINPANDLFTIGAGASNIKQPSGSARNAKFSLAYAITTGKWKNSLTLGYLNERYNIENLPRTSTQLVYPTLATKYIDAHHPLHPKKGISLEIKLSGANKNLLSQTSFFQTTLGLKTLYTIEKTKTRLLFRSDVGRTEISNLVQLPLSLQLFAGGAHSVRGYDYNSIGPGRNLVVASGEIQQRIKGNFYLAGFLDGGVVGDTHIFNHVNLGAGPGIAYLASIGTIELTIGNAFTQPNKPWAIQFTMGTAL